MLIDNFSTAAVLVTYNRVELLKRAIDSLLMQSMPLKYIVVVNNNSSDGTQEFLDKCTDERIKSIHLPENTGGAGGFHTGIDFASKLDITHVWIMDDDAFANTDALEQLVLGQIFIQSKKITSGFLCSNVVSDNNECMNVPAISKKRGGSGYFNWPEFLSEGIVGVDRATFVSIFLNISLVFELGLPVKEMFIWGDDSEYTWRISNKYQCFLIGKSVVNHKRVLAKSLSIVTEQNKARITWYKYLYRNNIYNIKTLGNKMDFIPYFYHVVNELLKVIIYAKDYKIYKIKTLISGLLSGFLFKPKIKYPTLKNSGLK
ncbi:glycosyltransferase [Pluralibacter gergoviae]|nr:glycosyltransferase [Pluralibacter gergoviae]ELC3016776.1 glycosyltransferase [Pluralibacter gergoviae]ELC3022295.1 glycosyltransferase [Pluralibacter gergoviae]